MEMKSTKYAKSQNSEEFDKLMKNIGFYQR